jgi:hypothetical protein
VIEVSGLRTPYAGIEVVKGSDLRVSRGGVFAQRGEREPAIGL